MSARGGENLPASSVGVKSKMKKIIRNRESSRRKVSKIDKDFFTKKAKEHRLKQQARKKNLIRR
jgi:hypothetical protein